MTTTTNPARMLFVNIPVADLGRSTAFFAKLGFSFNPAFTDDNAACMLVGEQAFVMLLSRETFAQHSKLPIGDPTTHALALYCFSAATRGEVDAICDAALDSGGTEADGADAARRHDLGLQPCRDGGGRARGRHDSDGDRQDARDRETPESGSLDHASG